MIAFTFRDIPERKEEAKESGKKTINKKADEEVRFFRLENLIQRRPFLLSNVVLR